MHSVEDVAKLLGVGKHKIFHWIETNELEAIDVSSEGSERRQWRIPDDSIDQFKQRRSNRSTATADAV